MVLAQAHPGGESAFFEIAATLIPLLLFGGVFVERVRPPSKDEWRFRHEFVGVLLALFGVIALFAEAMAIRFVAAQDASSAGLSFVAIVLVGGMTLVIAAICMPWLSRLRSSSLGFNKLATLSFVVLVGLCAAGATAFLIQGIDVSREQEFLGAYRKANAREAAEMDAVIRHTESLLRAQDRLRGQLEIAEAHQDAGAVKALTKEAETLKRVIRVGFLEQEQLLRKNREFERRVSPPR